MARKNKQVKFTNKEYSRRGMVSLVLSAFAFGWLVFAVCQTFLLGDAAGNVFGGVGMLALVLQIFAFVSAVRALREENVFRGIPTAAVVVAVVLFLLWAGVYGLGLYVTFA